MQPLTLSRASGPEGDTGSSFASPLGQGSAAPSSSTNVSSAGATAWPASLDTFRSYPTGTGVHAGTEDAGSSTHRATPSSGTHVSSLSPTHRSRTDYARSSRATPAG